MISQIFLYCMWAILDLSFLAALILECRYFDDACILGSYVVHQNFFKLGSKNELHQSHVQRTQTSFK